MRGSHYERSDRPLGVSCVDIQSHRRVTARPPYSAHIHNQMFKVDIAHSIRSSHILDHELRGPGSVKQIVAWTPNEIGIIYLNVEALIAEHQTSAHQIGGSASRVKRSI